MGPTKTEGLCGLCHWRNPYTEINCERCKARLPWAFLIDGKKEDDEFKPPAQKFLEHLLHLDRKTRKYNISCRFCNKPIDVNEKICPHCQNWLVKARNFREPVIDVHAPEIQRLYKIYLEKKEPNEPHQ